MERATLISSRLGTSWTKVGSPTYLAGTPSGSLPLAVCCQSRRSPYGYPAGPQGQKKVWPRAGVTGRRVVGWWNKSVSTRRRGPSCGALPSRSHRECPRSPHVQLTFPLNWLASFLLIRTPYLFLYPKSDRWLTLTNALMRWYTYTTLNSNKALVKCPILMGLMMCPSD